MRQGPRTLGDSNMKRMLMVAALMLLPGCAWWSQQSSGVASARAPFDAALHEELIAMRVLDQQARSGADANRMMVLDRKHTARMKAIVAAHGWPGRSLVGEDGASAA